MSNLGMLEGVSIHSRIREAGKGHGTRDGFDKNAVTSINQGDCVGCRNAAAVRQNEFACLIDCDRLLRRCHMSLFVV